MYFKPKKKMLRSKKRIAHSHIPIGKPLPGIEPGPRAFPRIKKRGAYPNRWTTREQSILLKSFNLYNYQ